MVKAAAASTGTSLMDSMEVVEKIEVPLRGRPVDPDVIAIREQLEACLKDKKARSFSGVEDSEKETFARKVRNAGELKGKDPIEVTTRYDKVNQKLLWGPKSVMQELSAKRS